MPPRTRLTLPTRRRPRPTGRRRTVIGLVLGAAAAWAGVTGLVFVWPDDSAQPTVPADAVVVFAGGRGERLAEARRLIDEGVAPTLVISNGQLPTWPQANQLCDGPPPGVDVLCPTPEPDNTAGEGAMVQRLAAERGWDRVLVVTSDFHRPRSGLWARRCAAGSYEVDVRGVDSRYNGLQVWGLSLREQVGILAALTVQRDCPDL